MNRAYWWFALIGCTYFVVFDFPFVFGKVSDQHNVVTCGSALKLLNTHFNVRLHSHEVRYGSGSGQQSVTGVDNEAMHESYWQIEGTSQKKCHRGEPVSCGQKIRFIHLSTMRNLHTHHFASPFTGNQEVSAFGENGVGDDGDNWQVECDGPVWTRKGTVRFRHVDTGGYLMASGHLYGRPISGHMEICAAPHAGLPESQWVAAEGVYVKQSSPDSAVGRNQSDEEDDEDVRSNVEARIVHDSSEL